MATAAGQTQADVSEFFPTPPSVITRMIAPIASRLGKATILEPSAGKGDILDRIASTYHVSTDNCYAIESNLELRLVLSGKGYRVIGGDFLAFNEPYRFDLIIMNPPFSNAIKHILRAWDIVAPGGAVVSLLNGSNIDNPHTEERKLINRLAAEHGRTTRLGKAFRSSARHTDVDVAMIVLFRPERETTGAFDDLSFDAEAPAADSTFEPLQVAPRNKIKALVDQYNAVIRLIKKRHEINQRLDFYTDAIYPRYGREKRPTLNEQITQAKAHFWRYIFDKTKLGSVTTSQVREEFEQARQQNAHMAFTVDNIMTLLEAVVQNYQPIMQQCIVEAFDAITSLHEKNTVHTEGWKTNKSWHINRKIIVPYGVRYERRWDSWSFAPYKRDFYADLDKACCFLAGQNYDDLRRKYEPGKPSEEQPARTIDDAITDHIHGKTNAEWNEPFESEFFTIRVHKKGTVHLTFRDEALWHQFNQAAAEGKAWVGPGY